MKQKTASFVLLLVLVVSGVFSTMVSVTRAQTSIGDVQDNISELSKKLKKAQAQQAALSTELSQINSSLSATQQAIATTRIKIAQAANDIERKQAEVDLIQERIEGNRLVLAGLIREIQAASREPFLDALLSDEEVTLSLNAQDRRLAIENRITGLLSDIHSSQDQTVVERQNLEQLKQTHEAILGDKIDEKQALAADQQETQADLADQRKVIADLQSKLNALRSRYSELLGESVSTDDILKAAKFAASATGMNKSFLLGVLVQESNKGQSVGTCDYKESKMTSTQLSALKKIADELDYNYKKLKFSCPPKSYSGTGGAMGVAQFMPTTWLGYQGTISSLTGHHPPDPWNLVDGVTAMASKLANDGAAKKDRFYEAKSYCVYLAGSNWGYYCYGSASKYKKSYKGVNCWGSTIKNYGEKVLCLKDNYEQFYE